jgi:hypothetical protein
MICVLSTSDPVYIIIQRFVHFTFILKFVGIEFPEMMFIYMRVCVCMCVRRACVSYYIPIEKRSIFDFIEKVWQR